MISSRITTPRALTLTALALCATSAMAQESGYYAGASVGKALPPDSSRITIGSDIVLTGGGDDETDQMWQLFAGYRINRHFAVEAGYLDLGAAHDVLATSGGATDARVNARFRAHGPTLSLIAAYPIGKWQPYARVGMLFSDVELSVSGSVGGTPFASSVGGKGTDLMYGIGLAYNINERWQIRLDLMQIDHVGNDDATLARYQVASLGFSVRF